MYTRRFQFVPKVFLLQSSEVGVPRLLELSELGNVSDTEILCSIVGREIASLFGVGTTSLMSKLSKAARDVVSQLSDSERDFFYSLRCVGGLYLDGHQMKKAEQILSGFRKKIPSLDILLKDSPKK